MPASVAFVIDELEVGGTQRQLYLMAKELATRGWPVRVICLQPVLAVVPDFDRIGIPVSLVRKRRTFDPTLVRTLARFFRTHNVDLIHAFSSTAEFYGALAARRAGRPFVASIRTWAEKLPLHHRIAKRAAMALADAVVANSHAGYAEALAARPGARRKLHVVPNGIDLKRFAPSDEDRRNARRALGLADEALVVASVGRLIVDKDYETAIEIARATRAALPQGVFVVAGDGPHRPALERQIRRLALERRFLLLGDRPDVRPLLAAADLYLSTSRREGMSNAIMEAMAAGLPVVASSVGGTPEIVTDGDSGFLFPAGDVVVAVERVVRLLTDPGLRRSLGDHGRLAIATGHGTEAMISRLERVYRSVLPRSDA
jgi:glycosyltransferase involved in cell wall biosynthesis